MRLFLLAFVLALAGCHQAPAHEPPKGHVQRSAVHPFPEAAEVRLFVETGFDKKTGNPVIGRKQGRILTHEQRRAYESLLFVATPVNLSPDDPFFMRAMCFIPHHFFRYFDASGRQVGEVAVCFCCSGVEMTPASRLPLHGEQEFGFDYAKLEALIGSWGEPTDVQCD